MRQHVHRWMVPLLIFFFSLIFHLTVNKIFILDIEESTHIGKVMRTMQGDLPLRDFVQFTYAPGHYYFFAALFWLFSPSLMIERLAWTVLRTLVSVLMYLTARRLMPPRYALFPVVLITVLPCAHWKTFYPFFTLLNLLFIFHLLDGFSKKWVIYSGLIAGLTLCFRQDLALIFGGTTACCVLLNSFGSLKEKALVLKASVKFFILRSMQTMGLYFTAMLIPFLPLLSYYFSRGSAIVLLREMFIGHPSRHLKICQSMPYHFPGIDKLFRWPLDLQVVFLWLPLVLFLYILIKLAVRLSREKHFVLENRRISALLLASVLIYNQTYLYAIFERLLESAAPIYLCMGYVLFHIHSKIRKVSPGQHRIRTTKRILYVPILAFFFIIPIAYVTYGLTTKYSNDRFFSSRNPTSIIRSESGIWLPRKWFQKRLVRARSFLKREGSRQDLMLFLNGSLNYFIADQKSLERFEINVKPLTAEALKKDLEIIAPRFVAIENWAFYTIQEFPLDLQKYLNDKYTFRIKRNVYHIYEKQ
jgi:hypothetical protein